jgi:hypothetical protein
MLKTNGWCVIMPQTHSTHNPNHTSNSKISGSKVQPPTGPPLAHFGVTLDRTPFGRMHEVGGRG